MGIKNDYYIRPISHNEAMQVVLKNHYLHRMPLCSYSFGLFRKEDYALVGCVTYGSPPSRELQSGICGEDEADNVIELNRLWIADGLPKNCASYLVSHTIKKLPKEIIVSFADTGVGHVGYIYQATNFLYIGKSAKRKDWYVKGLGNVHSRSLSKNHMTAKRMKEIYGDSFCLVDRSTKNKYVYFNAHGKRKRELTEKLRFKIQPYPKGDTNKVEVNTNEIETQISFEDMLKGGFTWQT